MRGINRRTMLRGLLGGSMVSIGLPPLEMFFDAHGEALASTGIIPRRFGLFWWGNGMLPATWAPRTTGLDWEPSEQLAPLAPLVSKISVVTGMSVRITNTLPHTSGAIGFLTGQEPAEVNGDHTYAVPTLDQVIAAEVGGETRFRSLETAAQPGSGLSHNGPFSANPHESDPATLFARIFGGDFVAPGEERVIDPRLALRRSVLDVVTDRAKAIQSKVGQADAARLEQHLDGIRDLELRIARLESDPPALDACIRPEAPPADVDISTLTARHRLITDLLVMALACDQTRVFSHVLSPPVDNWLYPGASEGHHQLTHNEGGDQPEVHAIVVQIMEEFRYFLSALDAVQEGAGTLLDSCAVLGTSEVSLGKTHSIEDFPILIAGGACGALKTGLHHEAVARENVGKVSLSLIRAMGINQPSWGAGDSMVTEGLTAIEV